jgi:hypothetical protein
LINALWEEVGGRAAAAVAWRSCITTVVSIGLKAVAAHCAGRDGSGRLINDASPGRRVLDLVVQRSLRGRRRDAALPDGGVGDGGDRLLLVTGTAIEAAFPSVDGSVALMASCILMVL